MTEATPTPQAPAAAEPVEPAAAATATSTTEAPKPGDLGYAFKSEESANAVLADLAKVREQNKALKEQFEAQGKAIAAAFGLEEAPKTEDLAETVKTLQQQIVNDRRAAHLDRLYAANGIEDDEDKALLTETDPEKLAAQAKRVGALIAANKAAAATPEFQPNPGQGQGGSATPKVDDSYPSHWVPKKPATT